MSDLRLDALTQVDHSILIPLMQQEEKAWLRELDWDYSPINRILSTFMRQRLLPGYVASRGGNALGYTYFLIQHDKGIIGALFASGRDLQDVADKVLSQAIHWLKHSQSIRRIEAQVFPLNNVDLTSVFTRHDFRHFPREYLELRLNRPSRDREISCQETVVPWNPRYLAKAAEVTLRSYKGQVDALICEDYCSRQGCEGYLRSLVENPGCGVFAPDASFVGLDSRGVACGFIISSRISKTSAMIPQISIHPSHQGRGLGTLLIRRAFVRLEHEGCSTVRLTVSRQNRRAREWYARLGFELRREFGAYIWQRD